MKIVALIPARYQSSRFPGKMLADLAGNSLISTVYKNVVKTNVFDQVIVVTDDKRIFDEIKKVGGEVKISQKNHASGSDRIAEIAENLEADIVVNVQGDEPFIFAEPLQEMIAQFADKEVGVVSLMHKITAEIDNPNNVKVIVDKNSDAIYFSRSRIPFNRDNQTNIEYYKHVGIYAYRKNILLDFVSLPQSKLEDIEKLEQLRLLENNYKIRMVKTDYQGIGIDTKEDLEKAILHIKDLQKK